MWFNFKFKDANNKDVNVNDNIDVNDDQVVQLLIEFIEDTRDYLDRLILHGKGLIPELADSIKDMWNPAGYNRFYEVLSKIKQQKTSLLSILKKHGLTGKELGAKLKMVSHYFGELISGGGKDILIKFLNAVDVLLDSLLEALKINNAAKEIKDTVMVALG